MRKIRILLADDHAVLRAGLRALIDAQPDMRVVAEAGDGLEALRQAQDTHPDVAIVDISMPELSGIDAIERLRRRSAGTRVLILTMHDDVAYARAALAAGASGHIVKDVEGAELLTAIRAVHRGRTVVHLTREAGATTTAVEPEEPGPRPVGPDVLSERERQVLTLVAQGHTNREVADRLSLSVKTVETYRARLSEKLGLRTRAELFRVALRASLLPASDPPAPAPDSP
ncbi:MAG: response regulator transcription factor [Candidatus Rokuibacteriota bacterium]